jgi:hypothetical protein
MEVLKKKLQKNKNCGNTLPVREGHAVEMGNV